MTTEEEIVQAEYIFDKMSRDEPLTEDEMTFMAYSPYGYAGSCPSCKCNPHTHDEVWPEQGAN